MSDSVKQLQQRLTCSVCLDRYKQPKLLPCQHTFCLVPCLVNLADRVTNRIKCPECRTIHSLPFQGVEALPNNLTLLKFLDLDMDSLPSNCYQCERRGQNSKCADCGHFYCQNCKLIHVAHLQNEVKIKITNIRKAMSKLNLNKQSYESIRNEISLLVESLIKELKNREMILMSELDYYVQSLPKNSSNGVQAAAVDATTVNSFCDSADSFLNNPKSINDNQLAQMKKQCQLFFDQLKTLTETDNNSFNMNFTSDNYDETKSLVKRLGLLSQNNAPAYSTIKPFTSEKETQRLRATWNKPPEPIGFTVDLNKTYPQFTQSSRANKPEQVANTLIRSNTFVISSDPIEEFNQPQRPVDVNELYNVKRRARAKTPLTFNVMLDEPMNNPTFDEKGYEQSKPNDLFSAANYYQTPEHPRIDYSLKQRAKRIIGKQGKEPGEFTWPIDSYVNAFNDNIYVTDSSNHRVQIFDQDGKFIKFFGRPGVKEGEMNSPTGIFIDSMSNVFVVDRLNNRIQIFDRYCRFLRSIGSGQGNKPGQLNNPWGVAVNKISELFVCDKENDRISVFHLSGRFLRSFGQHGSGKGCFDKPCYLHIVKDNKIFVSDSMNNRIQVFDSNGVFLYMFGREGVNPGEFKQPRGITSDSEGFILIADSGNSRIQVFKSDGSYVTHFGTSGSDSGKFRGLEGITFNRSGDLMVCDRDNNRIQIF